MIRNKDIQRNTFLCLLLLVCSCSAIAQNVVFTAAAGAGKMGLKDQVQIQYTIQDVNELQNVTPVGINNDFNVLGGPYSSQSTQVSFVNGKMTQSKSVSITYVVQPKRIGNLVIPPAIAKDGSGRVYQSNPLNIQVINGSVMPQAQARQRDPFDDEWQDPFEKLLQQRQQQLQALRQQQSQAMQQQQQETPVNSEEINKNLFIKVVVDKSKVHVGEQITASYKLYARLPMNVQISKLPSLNGFWTQDFEMPKSNIKPVEEVIDGKKYQVFTLKKSALFPQQTGMLELDPAEAEGIARIMQQARQRNPLADDPFASFFMGDPFFNSDFFGSSYKDVKVHLKSSPVKITVTPLPDDSKPAEFGNAVGRFTIAGKIEKTELTTDDVANYKLTITGSGNLKLIEAPKFNMPNGLDVYDPQIVDTITGRSTAISGSKIITYAIAPRTPGDYTIPALAFSYFDPQTGKYTTLSTEPVKLHVKQGKGYKGSNFKQTALTDIRNIETRPLKQLSFNSRPLFFSVIYMSMYLLPMLLFVGIAAWRRREDELSKDSVLLRNKRANKVALKRLTTAQKLLQQNQKQPFYEEVSKAIWLYLSDKLSIPLSSLSRERAQEALTARNVPAVLQQKIEAVINDCEVSLYAGFGSSQMNQTYHDAVDVISKLEEIL